MVGWKQAVLHSGVVGEGAVPGRSSQFISFLLRLWSWGLMSPQTMQELARRALMDFDNALKDENKARLIGDDFEHDCNFGRQGEVSKPYA